MRCRRKSGLFETPDSIKSKRAKIGSRTKRRPGAAQAEAESGRRARLLAPPREHQEQRTTTYY